MSSHFSRSSGAFRLSVIYPIPIFLQALVQVGGLPHLSRFCSLYSARSLSFFTVGKFGACLGRYFFFAIRLLPGFLRLEIDVVPFLGKVWGVLAYGSNSNSDHVTGSRPDGWPSSLP
jgi:hypothetical protein